MDFVRVDDEGTSSQDGRFDMTSAKYLGPVALTALTPDRIMGYRRVSHFALPGGRHEAPFGLQR